MSKIKTLNVKLKNCYGIKELKETIEFDNKGLAALYARNGLMKTSFAKTMKKIQDGKKKSIKDEIYNIPGEVEIFIDDKEISKEDIFVIPSYDSDYETDVTDLLVNPKINKSIKTILDKKDNFYSMLEKKSGIKIKQTRQGVRSFPLEETIISDLKLENKSFLLNISSIDRKRETIEKDFSDIKYSVLFNEKAQNKILDIEFQNGIMAYLDKMKLIYNQYPFLSAGELTLPKLKEINKQLMKNSFFTNGKNKILLEGQIKIKSESQLKECISEIEQKLKDTDELKNIEKLLSDVSGRELKDEIEKNIWIVEYLSKEKYEKLAEEIWLSYFNYFQSQFSEIVSLYSELKEEISRTDLNTTQWKESLDIFNRRFTVPYKMEIENYESVIIGESLPKIQFVFQAGDRRECLNKESLENLDVLSRGEKRALYLLNVIFEIEKIKKNSEKKIIIVDDIADSFDYKNKYAIIEYLYELSLEENFNMLILSHNFDFYRTVKSRLGINRNSCYIAKKDVENNVVLKVMKYQSNPLVAWKEFLYSNKSADDEVIKRMISLVPVVRNIVEYTDDSNGNEYQLLTLLLHQKENSSEINFEQLMVIYNKIFKVDCIKQKKLEEKIEDYKKKSVVEEMLERSKNIDCVNYELEDQAILAMSIRHYTEKILIKLIKDNDSHPEKTLENIKKNQFFKLKRICEEKHLMSDRLRGIIDRVYIMTPEHIHVNTFMFEPLIDLGILEMKNLYDECIEMYEMELN